MSAPETQERAVPTVPEGTPGHDWRAGLPAPLPPGAQQPWRHHGPGTRTWVAVVTAIAAVAMAAAGIAAVSVGFLGSAFDRSGYVVLDASQYTANQTTCTGAGAAASVREGTTITFRSGDTTFGAELQKGALRSGKCALPFEVSALDASSDRTYSVSVGAVRATPVSGDELHATDPVVVYLAPR